MNAILWKELRECGKWAAAAFILLGGLLAWWAISMQYSYNFESILSEEVQAIAFIAVPVLALGLGTLQTLPEVRQDRWAFLIHRGVSTSRIFLAKTMAGLLLYSIAAGGPLLMLWGWTAWEGVQTRPYHAAMMLPYFALLLTGVGFYFVAVMISLWPARWYGPRLFPLLAAGLPFAALLFQIQELDEIPPPGMFLAIAAAVVLLGLGAGGTFVRSGEIRGQPRGAGMATGVVLGAAALALLLTAAGSIIGVSDELRSRSRKWTAIRLDGEGRLWQLSLAFRPGADSASVEETRSLEDPPVARPSEPSPDDRPLHRFRHRPGVLLTLGRDRREKVFHWRDREAGSREHCFYSTRHRLLLLYLSERTTEGRVLTRLDRWIGPDGFSPAGELPGRSFGDLVDSRWERHWDPGENPGPDPRGITHRRLDWDREFFVFTDGIYAISFGGHSIREVYRAPAGDAIHGVSFAPGGGGMEIAIVHSTAIRFFEAVEEAAGKVERPDGTLTDLKTYLPTRQIGEVALPPDAAWYPGFQLARRRDGTSVYLFDNDLTTVGSLRFVETGADGGIIRRRDVAAGGHSIPLPHLALIAVVAPAGPVAALAAADGAWQTARGTGPGILFRFLRHQPLNASSVLAIVLASALGCGFLAARMARRRGCTTAGRRGWAAAGALLGPAGLLSLAALRKPPGLRPCPACGRRRVVIRESCEHCGAGFGRPARDGSEVIENRVPGDPVGSTL